MGEWVPYQPDVNDKITRAHLQGERTLPVKLGPKAWSYEIDLSAMVQRNAKSGAERQIRCVDRPPQNRVGCVTCEELDKAIAYFVEMMTLPEAPSQACNDAVAASDDLPYEEETIAKASKAHITR